MLLFALSVASFVLQPAGNAFSRHFEHQADVYGQEAIHGIVADPQKTAVSAFNHLGEAWLEDPNPSPFIEFWSYNHPCVQTRANFARTTIPGPTAATAGFSKVNAPVVETRIRRQTGPLWLVCFKWAYVGSLMPTAARNPRRRRSGH